MNERVNELMGRLVAAVESSVKESLLSRLQQDIAGINVLRNGSAPKAKHRAPRGNFSIPNAMMGMMRKPRRGKWAPGSRGRVPASATKAQRREHKAILENNLVKIMRYK